MQPVRFGVVGLGAGAEPHLKSLADLNGRAELVLAATPSEARAAARRATLPCPITTDVGALIADPGIDAVILITPPASHRELALACFAAGKHVLVEKPVAITAAAGQDMVEAADARGLKLGVMLQHRMRPGALRLRAALAEGLLGAVASASVAVDWWRPQSYYDEPGRGTMARDGGGVLLTQAIHAIDLFRSLVGVTAVEAAQVATSIVHRMETEDLAHALVRLDSGAPGVISATTAAYPGSPERIEIIGAGGTAKLIGGGLVIALHDGRREIVESENATGGSGASIMDFPHDAHRAVIADFCAALREGRDPAIPGREAVASQRLIERILEVGGRAPPAAGKASR